jgi:cytochrome c5
MKKQTVWICLCAAILLFSNCFKKANPTAAPRKTPAEEIVYAKTHYTDAQRAAGMAIFEKSCQECHDLPVPGEYAVHELDDILPKMFRKAKLNYDDAGLVKAYLVVNAKGE